MSIYQNCGWKKDRILYKLSDKEKENRYQQLLNKYFTQESFDKYNQELMDSKFWKEYVTLKRAQDVDKRLNINDYEFAFIYALIRKLKPATVVETGVHYGASTSVILYAMKQNKKGKLISIDVCKYDNVGMYIPSNLKSRWKLIEGKSSEILPTLNKKFDMFFHDSLHSYKNMYDEMVWALDNVKEGGLILADDIGCNNSFFDFAHNYNLPWYLVKGIGYGFGVIEKVNPKKAQKIIKRIAKPIKNTWNPILARDNFEDGIKFAERCRKELSFDVVSDFTKRKGINEEYLVKDGKTLICRIAPRNGARFGGYFKGKSFRVLNKKEEEELMQEIKNG